MDDKCIMENILLTTKGVCDLYLHGTIESSTANVHQSFDSALKCPQRAGIRRNRLHRRRSQRLRISSPECKQDSV